MSLFYPIQDSSGLLLKTEIRAMSLDGNQYKSIVTDHTGGIDVIAADCEFLYFATDPAIGGPGKGIMQVSLANGMPMPLPMPMPPNGPFNWGANVAHMVVTKNNLFWTDNFGAAAWRRGTTDYTRLSSPDAGFEAIGLAAHGAPDNQHVFWSEASIMMPYRGRIHHAVFVNGMQMAPDEVIADYTGRPGHMAVDNDYVYWVDNTLGKPNTIMRIPRIMPMQQMPEPILTANNIGGKNLEYANTLAIDEDGAYLYFVEGISTSTPILYRYDKATMGSKSEPWVDAGFEPQWLIGDSRRIYMASPRTAQIDWIAK